MLPETIIHNAPSLIHILRQNLELRRLCEQYDQLAFVAGLDADRLVHIFAEVLPHALNVIRRRLKSHAGRGHEDLMVAEALSKHRELFDQILQHLETTSIMVREHGLHGAEALLQMEERLYPISQELVLWTRPAGVREMDPVLTDCSVANELARGIWAATL